MKCARALLSCGIGFSLLLGCLSAQSNTYQWTGKNGSYAGDSGNWLGEVLPPADGSAVLQFGGSNTNFVYYEDVLHAMGIQITGNTRPYVFSLPTLTLGSLGLLYSPDASIPEEKPSSFQGNVALAASQTWAITSGRIELWGSLLMPETTEVFTLTKTGAGTLDLLDNSGFTNTNWNGHFIIRDGLVVVHGQQGFDGDFSYSIPTNALGLGTVTIDSTQGGMPGIVASDHAANSNSGDFGYYEDLAVIIPNAFSLNGRVILQAQTQLNLTGSITLAGDTTLAPSGDAIFIEGPISDGGQGHKLTINDIGLVILDAQTQAGNEGSLNTYSGGTHVENGALIFANASSLPEQGQLTMSSTGYIGYGDTVGVSTFLSRFDPANAAGVIGFDSDPDLGPPNTLPDAINLSGFNPGVRLGSVTSAILSGEITPAGTNYQFGGGGGRLGITSVLTDGESSRGIEAISPNFSPLSVYILNPGNTLSGGVQATHSGIIFGSGALPGSLPLNLGPGGYIGTIEQDLNYADHLARFTGNQGIIGFDIDPLAESPQTRVLNTPLTLPANYYIGTSSRVEYELSEDAPGLVLAGELTGATEGENEVFRFAAYKGGILEVASNITSTNGKVYIGDPNSTGAFGDPNEEEYSVVALTGNNSYGGTTTLYTGHLQIGQSNGVVGTDPTSALGTGALIIQPHNITLPGEDSDELYPLVSALHQGTVIGNLVSVNANLSLGGDNDMRFTNTISGTGSLLIGEDSENGLDVRLDGANGSFSGGIYVKGNSSVTFGGDTSAGTGRLGFGESPNGIARFLSQNPVIGGLESDQGGYIYIEAGSTLHINQSDHTTFRGSIFGNSGEPLVGTPGGGFEIQTTTTVEFNGPGSLRLTDDQYVNTFRITGGTLVIGNEGDGNWVGLGDTVQLQGGAIVLQNTALETGTLDLQSGTLAGNGYFVVYSGNIPTVGNNVILSPGTPGGGGVGHLQFDELTLASGGEYVWNLRDAGSGDAYDAMHDFITVGASRTLHISATSEDPFIITPVTLTSSGVNGILGGLTEGETYSWTLMSYLSIDGITEQFNPSNVQLNLGEMFQTTLAGNARLEFTSLDSSGYVMLHFTAVPEPSTYALLALGLGFVGYTVRRRRRAA